MPTRLLSSDLLVHCAGTLHTVSCIVGRWLPHRHWPTERTDWLDFCVLWFGWNFSHQSHHELFHTHELYCLYGHSLSCLRWLWLSVMVILCNYIIQSQQAEFTFLTQLTIIIDWSECSQLSTFMKIRLAVRLSYSGQCYEIYTGLDIIMLTRCISIEIWHNAVSWINKIRSWQPYYKCRSIKLPVCVWLIAP